MCKSKAAGAEPVKSPSNLSQEPRDQSTPDTESGVNNSPATSNSKEVCHHHLHHHRHRQHHHHSNLDGVKCDGSDCTTFRVHAGAPQLIRVAGFRDVFERYFNRLDQATCQFGIEDEVDCRCDTLQGTVECDVPRPRVSPGIPEDGMLVVKARVAEFETPPLAFRYSAANAICDEKNVLLRPSPEDDESEKEVDVPASTRHARILTLISRERRRDKAGRAYSLLHQCIAEMIGTMFIVVFGVGSVCSAVLFKENVALWHIATVWGFGVALAILCTASVSGAHLNPAVSLALAIFRPHDFHHAKLLPYWAAQYLGGILGGAFNLMIFGPAFTYYEAQNNIIRGQLSDEISSSSVVTASAFGEYFPAPGYDIAAEVVSPTFAMLVEAWGTGILMFVILALTDPRQKIIRNKEMLPFYIGFTVAVLITLYAPLTQAGWNPARDFGPRVVAALAGWGRVAIPGPRNGFWVYIIGPKIGAPVAAFLYDFLINPGLTNG